LTARPHAGPEVRIGVVGCGRAASSLHLPALARVPGARIVALADSDAGRLAALAARLPGVAAYGDARGLLNDDRVDLVAVCTPASGHADIAIASLGAGKHLFVEKPLALTLDDCDRMVTEARRAESSGLRSVVGFNLRSHRLMRQAKGIIASGALGEIELVRSLWTADWSTAIRPVWHTTRAAGGGALLEIGTHLADLWRWLLDSEVECVQAMSRSSLHDDQSGTIQARMTSGVLVTGAVSQRTATHNVLEVLGSRGSLRLSTYHADSLEVTAIGGTGGVGSRRIRPLLQRAARLPGALLAARGGGDFRLSYRHAWNRIVSALRTGEPMPASVEDGRRAVAVVLAVLQASADRSTVVPAAPAVPPVAEPRAG
jgi:predicted dehydrogenase